MSKPKNLLDIFKNGNPSWSDYSKFLDLKTNDVNHFLKFALELKNKNFGNQIKIYIPNKRFPAISITGDYCALACEHCNKKYLKSMNKVLNKDDLERFLFEHFEKGGVGALISGGCEPDGSVPLLKFLDSIRLIKEKTNLIINTHTGLLNEKTAKKLAEAGVDIVSFDITMDEEVIKKIYHLNKDPKDYKKSIEYLKRYNLNIVPHICIGLFYGKIHKELEAIKFLEESGIKPSLIVLIALIPPKDSNTKFIRPNPIDIAKVIALIRFVFPNTEISLGCMRPRGKAKTQIEKSAIMAGITRIEIPSIETLKWVKQKYPDIKFKFFSACCAIPEQFERNAKSKEFDLKKYREFGSYHE
ncbi:MAG: radical SAM protein [Candidatus Hermodarchaeota archaeon]